jgi:virginiamycin A acetyltransferase
MKELIRRLSFRLARIATWPLATLVRWSGSESLFVFFGQTLSLVPGTTGSYFRVAYYSQTLVQASVACRIGFGSFFSHREVVLRDGVYIGAYCIIGMADIGAHATIASRVSILSGRKQHGFGNDNVPVQQQGGVFTQVSIGANCWIGEGSIVMANVGNGCVVGAGAVVTKDHGNGLILVGNPARVLRGASGD